MGRGGLNTAMPAMDMFALDEANGAYSTMADESKALNESTKWNDACGVEDASVHMNDWEELLMGMDEAHDILLRPLEGPDNPASGSMASFNRSASAPDLLAMPGAPRPASPRPLTSQTMIQRTY